MPFIAPVHSSTSNSMIQSAAKASISHQIHVGLLIYRSISAILSTVIVISIWFKVSQPKPFRRPVMTTSVTVGRALRRGAARGFLNQLLGHGRFAGHLSEVKLSGTVYSCVSG
ncbi:hypothetical protein E4191_18285 (plasmid) [Paracoccus liaowanqingii]|uniref:Uncharacterized protein n=1 Tax=Paracoccus liaowanqingii TaxID=2560053 RepID=A0A4Y5SRF2_9RHOB|nr:hypothetical protein [Paracoccus liaowanqingii]QDA36077.1 hypothetical protein E4191_18285 [Paracoccus liaowanqingii]